MFLRNLINLSLFPFLLAAFHWAQFPHKTERSHHSQPPPNGKNQKSSWAEPTLAEHYMDIHGESRGVCSSLWLQIPSHSPGSLLSPQKSVFSNVIQMDTAKSQKAFSESASQSNAAAAKLLQTINTDVKFSVSQRGAKRNPWSTPLWKMTSWKFSPSHNKGTTPTHAILNLSLQMLHVQPIYSDSHETAQIFPYFY